MLPTPAAKEFLREPWPDATDTDDDILQWLYDTFLYGKLANYVLEEGFQIVPAAYVTPSPRTKLEILLQITQDRREKFIGQGIGSTERVLSESQLKNLLDQWKDECWTWMHQETQDQWYKSSHQQWHQIKRRAFRTYLWEIIGCYEMTLAFLYAPFNTRNLTIFRDEWLVWSWYTSREDFINNVVRSMYNTL